MPMFRPELGLVLGGGGARGGAHLGVLRVLEKLDFEPELVVGTSIGGLLAIMIGSGWDSAQIEQIMRDLDFHKLIHLDRSGGGLLAKDFIEAELLRHFGDADLRDLSPKVALVAADIEHAERVLITEGPVVRAGLATSAVPGLYAPVPWGNRLLVDGGVLDNVPTQGAYELGAKRLLAVDVGGIIDLNAALHDIGAISDRFRRLFYWLLDLSKRQQVFDASIKSTMLTQYTLTQYELALYPPDVLIQPLIPPMGMMAFDRLFETVDIGEAAAWEAAERIRQVMRRPNIFPKHDIPSIPQMVTVGANGMELE